jgi:hypothetical protein
VELDDAEAKIALDSAVSSILSMAKIYEAQGGEAILRVVELYMQAAWIVLWLSEDVETAELFIQQVETGAVIDAQEKQRLEGWVAFRKNDLQTAKEKLEPLVDDPASVIGMALIYLEEGNKKAAALHLLSIAKQYGNTILGVWSKSKLEEVVGSSFQIRPEIPQLQELMSGVLRTMDEIASDPRPPIELQVTPTALTHTPYEPVWITITLTNNSPIPLTISKNGPLQPLVLLEVVLPTIGDNREQPPPVIVPIDTEFSIPPRKQFTTVVDLRQYWLGGVLNSDPLKGASFTVRGITNFMARKTTNRVGRDVLVYGAGSLGQQSETNNIRVNGVRLTDQWLEQALIAIEEITSVQDLITYVLLTWVVSDTVFVEVLEPLIPPPPGQETPGLQEGERHPNQDKAITSLLTVFPSLQPIEQAWVLATMSDDPTVEAVKGMVKEPDSTATQLAWVIRFATPDVPDEALDDQTLLLATQSENKTVQTVATWVYRWIEQVSTARNRLQMTPTP